MMPSHFESSSGRPYDSGVGNPFNHNLLLSVELGRQVFGALPKLPAELAAGGFTAADVLRVDKPDGELPPDELAATHSGLEAVAESGTGVISRTEQGGFRLPAPPGVDLGELSLYVQMQKQHRRIIDSQKSDD